MAKFVCCGLNFEAAILKKETKFTTICGFAGDVLMARVNKKRGGVGVAVDM